MVIINYFLITFLSICILGNNTMGAKSLDYKPCRLKIKTHFTIIRHRCLQDAANFSVAHIYTSPGCLVEVFLLVLIQKEFK